MKKRGGGRGVGISLMFISQKDFWNSTDVNQVMVCGFLSDDITRNKNKETKELSLCHKFSFCKTYIFATLWFKPLIFQTYIIWSTSIHSLKY